MGDEEVVVLVQPAPRRCPLRTSPHPDYHKFWRLPTGGEAYIRCGCQPPRSVRKHATRGLAATW